MLHRLALRVLPCLTLAVTEDSVRKRKRWVMFVPGLVAFACYRLAKQGLSLAEPMTLLLLSGVISMVTAGCAYRVGRGLPFSRLMGGDGVRRIGWVLVWIGFVYGVQLSLLVLALLWLVGYDYSKHPDGPAMMAIIIPCTAVARDAFEIGYLRWLESNGRSLVTFPDGAQLRTLLQRVHPALLTWMCAGAVACAGVSVALVSVASEGREVLLQGALVSLTAGTMALFAFFAGQAGGEAWLPRLSATRWSELMKFWWWPGLAFASTYYLVLLGGWLYVVKQPIDSIGLSAGIAAAVGGLMALYSYYLGHRRDIENREQGALPSALLRCPFVMGILGKSRGALSGLPSNESAAVFEKTSQRVSS
ncbi:MAG: rane protein of unknown function [Nitrospira sp.]|nr:rane protein of unknown function [Nitrospira sp.]